MSRPRFSKWNSPVRGSAFPQSTQHFTASKPTALIWSRSFPQRAALVPSSGSSMGARALPPPYQTATGKKSFSHLRIADRPAAEVLTSETQNKALVKRSLIPLSKNYFLGLSAPSLAARGPTRWVSVKRQAEISEAPGGSHMCQRLELCFGLRNKD